MPPSLPVNSFLSCSSSAIIFCDSCRSASSRSRSAASSAFSCSRWASISASCSFLYRLNRRILLSPCIRISSREEAASVIQRVSFVVSPVCGGVSPPSSSTYHSKSAASLRTAPTPWRRACPLRESCFHRYPHRQYHRLCRTRRSRSGASFPSCPKRREFPRMNSPFPLIPYFTIFTFVLQYISLKSLKSA